MAIYSRRVIQKIINESASFLDEEEASFFVKKLNLTGKECLAFEWELVLLNALSTFGKVAYEKILSGQSRPDIFFFPTGDHLPFVADITVVSDLGLHEENPIQQFVKEFERILGKHNLGLSGFSVNYEGDFVGKYHKLKMKLLIPQKGEITQFINTKLMSFILEVKDMPTEAHCIEIKDENVDMKVEYKPDQVGFSGGGPTHTSIYSREKNPITNKLKDKSVQLRKSGFDGTKGVFLCDGGCNTLREGGQMGSTLSVGEILNHFFRNNPSVSFVAVCSVQEKHHTFGKTERFNKVELYENKHAANKVSPGIKEVLSRLEQALPKPIVNVTNALNHIEFSKNKFGQSFFGAYDMGSNKIKMSSMELLETLAGKQATASNQFGRLNERFQSLLRDGKIITNISIEKVEDEDDDWIILEFETDPAVSPFVNRPSLGGNTKNP